MRCGLALQAALKRGWAPDLVCPTGCFLGPAVGAEIRPIYGHAHMGQHALRRRIEGHLDLRPVARVEIAGEGAADGLLALVVQITSTMVVSSPPRAILASVQLPPSGVRIRSFSPMQVRALLVPLPAPIVVISQSPAFRRGTSSALAETGSTRPRRG